MGLPLYFTFSLPTAAAVHVVLVMMWALANLVIKRWDNWEYSLPLFFVSLLIALSVPVVRKLRSDLNAPTQPVSVTYSTIFTPSMARVC